MKKLLLSIAALCIGLSLWAQEPEVVTDEYNRGSVSIVVVRRGDKHDELVKNAVSSINTGEKFDKNDIRTKSIRVDSARRSRVAPTAIYNRISNAYLGHEVVSSWFTVDNSGLMSVDKVNARGRYNADDQDVANSQIAKIGEDAMLDAGDDLINNSYVIVMDCYRFEEGETKKEQPKKGSHNEKEVIIIPNISATVNLSVYKVVFPKNRVYEFYYKCWIDAETPTYDIAARQAAFANMDINLVPVSSAAATYTVDYKNKGDREQRDAALRSAIVKSYHGAVYSLESQIEAWKVKVSVCQVHPIGAKIGTKEGLKNTARYSAHETVRKVRNGESIEMSKDRGYLRATKVANNSANATGDSPISEFYQISGTRNVKSGYVLKQSNDLGMGFSIGYSESVMSDISGSIDYLLSINSHGRSTYAIVDFGIKDYQYDMSAIVASVGVGYGMRLTRFVEVVPNIAAAADYIKLDGVELGEDESSTDYMKYFGKVGVKVNLALKYPVHLYVGAEYLVPFIDGGVMYEAYNEVFSLKRDGGLGISAGIRYVF